jgi:hypothetical protein
MLYFMHVITDSKFKHYLLHSENLETKCCVVTGVQSWGSSIGTINGPYRIGLRCRTLPSDTVPAFSST